MALKLSDFPQISSAPVAQKIELIDELWEDVRRSSQGFDASKAHLKTLEQRLSFVREDPSLALTPSEARAQLKR